MATRSDQIIVYRTVAAYEAILFGTREVDVLQHALETATASFASSKTRVEAGHAIGADALTATANLAERQQELIAAQGRVQIAWAELEAVIREPYRRTRGKRSRLQCRTSICLLFLMRLPWRSSRDRSKQCCS